jgi:multidrug resistance efflux pump
MENPELDSDVSMDLDESLGAPPSRILRWGISVIFGVLILVLSLTSIIRYPEIIDAPIIITTLNPPVQLVANANGKLQYLFVKDGQSISKDQILAVIENPSDYQTIIQLQKDVQELKALVLQENFEKISISNYGLLGDLQSEYNTLSRAVSTYHIFVNANSFKNKVQSLQNQIGILDKSRRSLNKQEQLLTSDFELTKIQFLRDSVLFGSGVLSSLSWESSKKVYLKDQYGLELIRANQISLTSQQIQITHSVQELYDQYDERIRELKNLIVTSLNSLNSNILKWENNYIIKGPTGGKVVLNEFWTAYQNVKFGDNLLIVVPDNPDSLIGRIKLSVMKSGKVKEGQRINIKLDSYPYVEYGMVAGNISRISSIADNDFYTVEVTLPHKLVTTYGISIDQKEKITGRAEIITEDLSLFQRFFHKFISIFKK